MSVEPRRCVHARVRRRVSAPAVAILLATSLVGPVAAADPTPVRDPGSSASTPSTADRTQVALQPSTSFGIGDVFVAVGNGQVQWRLPDGTLNATLDTGLGGYTTGMAFDKVPGNLYVTNFSAGAVTRFDPQGNRLGTFGSGYNSSPESIVFDAAGDALVGHASGSRDVLRFDGNGQFRALYDVPTGPVGSDWIDLAVDQCTLLYTSEGASIRRFNVCTNTPMSDLTGVLSQAFALRILPGSQGILVADRTTIKLVDNFVGGGVTKFYDAPGQDCWFALNLDPDGSSFWSADFCTSMVFKFDIASGTVLQSFSTGTPSRTVFGLVVNGEFSQARNRDCSSENLSLGQVGQIGDQVVVRYDPRYLVDESLANYTTQAQAMAEQIRSRAMATLVEYRDKLEFAVPDHVTIEIRCAIRVLDLGDPLTQPGLTESENLVKLRANYVRD
jgi:DNA-binding beta-propeller fold protein YncE